MKFRGKPLLVTGIIASAMCAVACKRGADDADTQDVGSACTYQNGYADCDRTQLLAEKSGLQTRIDSLTTQIMLLAGGIGANGTQGTAAPTQEFPDASLYPSDQQSAYALAEPSAEAFSLASNVDATAVAAAAIAAGEAVLSNPETNCNENVFVGCDLDRLNGLRALFQSRLGYVEQRLAQSGPSARSGGSNVTPTFQCRMP